jgi:hypothetical protein
MFVAAAAMGMLLAGTSAQAANTAVLTWSQGGTTITSYDFGTVDGVGGKTSPSQTFTLTNTGSRSTGTLAAVALTNASAAFSITSDGCTGLSLAPNKFCQVTVEYAPTTNGESDSATLTVTAEHAIASLPLTGQGGTADLTLSPGTLTGTDGNGTNDYSYDFGQVGSTISDTYTFTVTNSGTGTSNTLQLASCCTTGFTLSNDQSIGPRLAPGGTSTFDLTFSATCTAPTTFSTPLDVKAQDKGSPYISVTYTAKCGPPVPSTVATATLLNLKFNPQSVPEGNAGSPQPIAVLGTLTNVSFSTPPPPPLKCPPNCVGLHGFTIQIPFSLAPNPPGTTAGTLYCYMDSQSYQPGTCSVSNNVLTVTQNFTGLLPFHWAPVHGEQIGYVYVGSSVQPYGAQVTWDAPTLITVR